jgi:hypothetical protein
MSFLGSEEVGSAKIYYIIALFFVLAFLFYAMIGASPQQKELLQFYILFGFFLGIVPLLFDFVSRKELPLDTISIEESPISPKIQLLLGIVVSIGLSWWMFTTQQAFVQAPQFSMFDTPLGNAVVSALSGGFIETIVFFGFIFPTIHGITYRTTNSFYLALVIATIATTVIFTGFHNWVYKYNESALLSVAVFGLVNCALAALIRSNVVNIFMHSTNNLMVVLFSLTKMMFAVVI